MYYMKYNFNANSCNILEQIEWKIMMIIKGVTCFPLQWKPIVNILLWSQGYHDYPTASKRRLYQIQHLHPGNSWRHPNHAPTI